jgi:hypothetical protein
MLVIKSMEGMQSSCSILMIVYFKIRMFLAVYVQDHSTYTKGVGEVGGILELILFVTSADAIYLCLALAHQAITARGGRARVGFIQGHAAFS